MTLVQTTCPGCGLELPAAPARCYGGYYHVSQECWSVYAEVLGAEFSSPVLFGLVHQNTVDTYALQHAGGAHPDLSVGVHLAGLHLSIVQGLPSPRIAPLMQRLAAAVDRWPHLAPPEPHWELTVCDVALANDHVATVRAWTRHVWDAWSPHQDTIAAMVGRYL